MSPVTGRDGSMLSVTNRLERAGTFDDGETGSMVKLLALECYKREVACATSISVPMSIVGG